MVTRSEIKHFFRNKTGDRILILESGRVFVERERNIFDEFYLIGEDEKWINGKFAFFWTLKENAFDNCFIYEEIEWCRTNQNMRFRKYERTGNIRCRKLISDVGYVCIYQNGGTWENEIPEFNAVESCDNLDNVAEIIRGQQPNTVFFKLYKLDWTDPNVTIYRYIKTVIKDNQCLEVQNIDWRQYPADKAVIRDQGETLTLIGILQNFIGNEIILIPREFGFI